MDSSPHVLFQCLLADLSNHLPSDIVDRLGRREAVDAWPDITPSQYAALALGKSFYKKLVDDISPSADVAALNKFLSVNRSCGTWELKLDTSGDELLYGCFKQHLYDFFTPKGDSLIQSFGQIFDRSRCGPGASLGSVGGDSYTKLYSSDLTTSNLGLYRAYRCYIESRPDERLAELIRLSHYGMARVTTSSRLSFVPKQRDISRTICTEPILNMYGQLGLASIFESRLRAYFGINLSIQPDRNRALARAGSLDGSVSTIDLESASDSMSLKMLEAVLPPYVIGWLNMLRTPSVELPDGSIVEMNMVSTMGNGFTFPLQTIIFASVVAAACDASGLGFRKRGGGFTHTFGVFGDDIICESALTRSVIRLLTILGFKVNAAKSFSEGPFRESCGSDYFRGQNVRGVYVKTLRTPQSRAVVLNRLHQWVATTGLALPLTCRMLFLSIPKRFIPFWDNDDAGIKVPFSLVDGMRRSKTLQSILYRKWVPRTKRIKIEGIESFNGYRRIYNPYGLYLSFLSGHIRSSSISVRQTEVLYTTKVVVAPSWDPPRRLLSTELSWRRWESVVWSTLKG